ncbi:uncharacterized protein TOT_030000949 [Theileria orientalis strain Shintoku]|uniref:CS domain-containing protein n=1 Tax=Theileria orientalis strain Shintoku TaxID=869250 RepID=J4DPY7_THEOR|nr:uncharacterized protein TOT_030000949 [Theileria orientalis strain Shintoku]BAM41524.1 uncharacterized protein TOT_030000949 [Theileria orientalis strain Shintoku]|eukprot:XP_009691825.1 uncharacterized protein TOT_030000949 [Theileria orientalis strain Shintoku]
MTLYVPIDRKTTKKDITVEFKPRNMSIEINKNEIKTEIKGSLYSTISTLESYWIIEDVELEIHLVKALEGEVWECVMMGDDPVTFDGKELDKKKMLLERFQKEHPRFDFSEAEINGTTPDPRTYLRKN